MVHKISCIYTHQQNGFVERRHRHIVETTITLMHTAGLSQSFWFHACAHAVLLINRMPSVIGHEFSIFCLYNKHHDIAQVKVFGSIVFPYIKPYNHTKIQSRFLLCIILAYVIGCKGTICYYLPSKNQFLCKHVIHNEIVFPAKNSFCSSSVKTDWNFGSQLRSPIVITLPMSYPTTDFSNTNHSPVHS